MRVLNLCLILLTIATPTWAKDDMPSRYRSVAGFNEQGHFDTTFKAGPLAVDLVVTSEDPAATLVRVVYFDFDSSQLRDEFHPTLERIAKAVVENPGTKLEIAGYSPKTAPEDAAKRIALQRARNVRLALAQLGVPADRLSVVTDVKPLLMANTQPATEAEFVNECRVEIRLLH